MIKLYEFVPKHQNYQSVSCRKPWE